MMIHFLFTIFTFKLVEMFQQVWDFEKLTPKLAPDFETYKSLDIIPEVQ